MKRRLFSLLLCGAVLLSLCQVTALAADAVPYLDANGTTQTCITTTEVTKDDTTW